MTTKTVAFMVKNSSSKAFVRWLNRNGLTAVTFIDICNIVEDCQVCKIVIPYPFSDVIIETIKKKLIELDEEGENGEKEG